MTSLKSFSTNLNLSVNKPLVYKTWVSINRSESFWIRHWSQLNIHRINFWQIKKFQITRFIPYYDTKSFIVRVSIENCRLSSQNLFWCTQESTGCQVRGRPAQIDPRFSKLCGPVPDLKNFLGRVLVFKIFLVPGPVQSAVRTDVQRYCGR